MSQGRWKASNLTKRFLDVMIVQRMLGQSDELIEAQLLRLGVIDFSRSDQYGQDVLAPGDRAANL